MPTPTSYTKSISTDFPNGKVNTSTLVNEINISPIAISLLRIDTEEDNCDIWFRDVLSSEDITVLDALVQAHTGDKSKLEISTVQIVEESTGTGGFFCTRSINIWAEANSSTTEDVSWPYPVSALSIKLTTDDISSYDQIDMSVGPNTVVGILTSNSGNNPVQWTDDNYTVGSKVLYTVPVFGERVFTCILDTTAEQSPMNKTYWRHGYELSVSSTVLENSQIGFYINLMNGTENQDLGRILYKTINSIFVENAPSTNFLAASPTYVRQTVYVLKGHYIGNGKVFSIGDGKIGGSYVPTDTIVRVKYSNNGNTDKRLLGFVEYLY